MRVRLPRPVRRGLPAVAVLVLALGACSDPSQSTDPTPVGPAAPPTVTGTLAPTTAGTGSDGLTVRYLDHGSVKTVRVEDFPR